MVALVLHGFRRFSTVCTVETWYYLRLIRLARFFRSEVDVAAGHCQTNLAVSPTPLPLTAAW
jgi:hypothetical protein